jgi:hypothetical protein
MNRLLTPDEFAADLAKSLLEATERLSLDDKEKFFEAFARFVMAKNGFPPAADTTVGER